MKKSIVFLLAAGVFGFAACDGTNAKTEVASPAITVKTSDTTVFPEEKPVFDTVAPHDLSVSSIQEQSILKGGFDGLNMKGATYKMNVSYGEGREESVNVETQVTWRPDEPKPDMRPLADLKNNWQIVKKHKPGDFYVTVRGGKISQVTLRSSVSAGKDGNVGDLTPEMVIWPAGGK